MRKTPALTVKVNPFWAVLPLAYSDVIPVRPRHLIPLAFVFSLLVSAGLGFLGGGWLSLAVALPYTASALLASLLQFARERDTALLATLPIAFATLHLTYGAGSLWGSCRLLAVILRRALPQPRTAL